MEASVLDLMAHEDLDKFFAFETVRQRFIGLHCEGKGFVCLRFAHLEFVFVGRDFGTEVGFWGFVVLVVDEVVEIIDDQGYVRGKAREHVVDVVGDAGLELRWEEVARHRVDHHSGGGHQEHHLRGGQVGLITEEEKDILIFFFWFCWEFRKGKWWWRKSKVVVLVIYNGDFGSVYVWE